MVAKTVPKDKLPKKPVVKKVDGGRQVTFPSLLAKDKTGKTIQKDANPVPLVVVIPDAAVGEFELLDELRAIQVDQNAVMLPSVFRRLVGDQFREVMDALRDPESGRVPIETAVDWLGVLMEALNPNS